MYTWIVREANGHNTFVLIIIMYPTNYIVNTTNGADRSMNFIFQKHDEKIWNVS